MQELLLSLLCVHLLSPLGIVMSYTRVLRLSHCASNFLVVVLLGRNGSLPPPLCAPLNLTNQARWIINYSYYSYRLSPYVTFSLTYLTTLVAAFGAALIYAVHPTLTSSSALLFFIVSILFFTRSSNPDPLFP